MNAEQDTDIPALMAKIRQEIKAELDGQDLPAQKDSTEKIRGTIVQDSGPLLYSEELNYLNQHWGSWAQQSEITSHRKFLGPFIVKAKKALVRVVWEYVLKDYFEAERRFQSNLVRHLNANARYTDSRIKDTFWQIIEKVDNDIEGLNRRTDNLLSISERTADESRLEVKEQLTELKGKLRALETVFSGAKDLGEGGNLVRPLTQFDHLPPDWRKSIDEINSLVQVLNSRADS